MDPQHRDESSFFQRFEGSDLEPRPEYAEWLRSHDPERAELVGLACDLQEHSGEADPKTVARYRALLAKADDAWWRLVRPDDPVRNCVLGW